MIGRHYRQRSSGLVWRVFSVSDGGIVLRGPGELYGSTWCTHEDFAKEFENAD